jgi:hypothetical protein
MSAMHIGTASTKNAMFIPARYNAWHLKKPPVDYERAVSPTTRSIFAIEDRSIVHEAKISTCEIA